MTTTVTPDKTQRIVLTKALRDTAGFRPGEALKMTAQLGSIIIAPARHAKGKLVRRGKLKVFDGDIPDMDIAEAVNAARHYTR